MTKLYVFNKESGTVLVERMSDVPVSMPTEQSAPVIDEFMDVPVGAASPPTEAQLERLDKALLQSPFWRNN